MDLDSYRFSGVSTKDIHKLPTGWYRGGAGYFGLSTGTVPVVDRQSPGLSPAFGYLPMQKLEKIRPSKASELTFPVISPKLLCIKCSSSATNSPALLPLITAIACER